MAQCSSSSRATTNPRSLVTEGRPLPWRRTFRESLDRSPSRRGARKDKLLDTLEVDLHHIDLLNAFVSKDVVKAAHRHMNAHGPGREWHNAPRHGEAGFEWSVTSPVVSPQAARIPRATER